MTLLFLAQGLQGESSLVPIHCKFAMYIITTMLSQKKIMWIPIRYKPRYVQLELGWYPENSQDESEGHRRKAETQIKKLIVRQWTSKQNLHATS